MFQAIILTQLWSEKMTKETILTIEDIRIVAQAAGCNPSADDGALVLRLSRAIEQAVLQSEQVQALRKDAERIQFVADKHCMFDTRIQADGTTKYRLGWNAGTKWRVNWFDSPSAAIDAAMEKQK